MTALAPRERGDVLDALVLRLGVRFAGRLDPEVIRAVVDECYDELLARATVTAFLPVLTERRAAVRLAALP